MADIMGPPGNQEYFTRRESQERNLAALAVDRAVRCAHLRMADHYAALVREQERVMITVRTVAA
ncbi:MAG TPA: hypothetical protein VFT56_11475 [Sphingomonas sp.]|nr:hypothetical protein [Sphingomonas sp.]